jgi:hypothetical protein
MVTRQSDRIAYLPGSVGGGLKRRASGRDTEFIITDEAESGTEAAEKAGWNLVTKGEYLGLEH